MTCLLQLAMFGKDYVIDVLAPGVWSHLGEQLRPIFADPAIVKIGHGIDGMDVVALYRDLGIFVLNEFDSCE